MMYCSEKRCVLLDSMFHTRIKLDNWSIYAPMSEFLTHEKVIFLYILANTIAKTREFLNKYSRIESATSLTLATIVCKHLLFVLRWQSYAIRAAPCRRPPQAAGRIGG